MSSTCCRTSSRPTSRSGWKLRTRSCWTLTSDDSRRWTWTWRTCGWIITGWGEWVRLPTAAFLRVNRAGDSRVQRESIILLKDLQFNFSLDTEMSKINRVSHQFVCFVHQFVWKFFESWTQLQKTSHAELWIKLLSPPSATCDFRGKPFVRQQTGLNWHWSGDLSKYYDLVCGVTWRSKLAVRDDCGEF